MAGNDNWRWQGRQYHMWFGHGTRPNQENDAGSGLIPASVEERIRILGQTALAGLPARLRGHPNAYFAGERQAQLRTAMLAWVGSRHASRRDFAEAMFGVAPDVPGVRAFHDAALSLGEARSRADMRDAADDLAEGMAAVGLDRFPRVLAEAADRAERGGSGLLVPVQYRRGGTGPTRLPGGGWREMTPGERIRLDRYTMALERLRAAEPNNRYVYGLSAPNTVPSEEFVRQIEREAELAVQRSRFPGGTPPAVRDSHLGEIPSPRFTYLGPGGEWNVTGSRREGGVVTTSGTFSRASGMWVTPDMPNGAEVPLQVVEQLAGRRFSSFDAFRAAFWKAVANTPELHEPFSASELSMMRIGRAPQVFENDIEVGRRRWELHHVPRIRDQGPVYDLGHLRVIAPSRHIDLHRNQ